MNQILARRAKELRSRIAVRGWEYRQRNHAKGVWFRIRRLLAGADRAFVVDRSELERLQALGYRPEPAGSALDPPKTILVVPLHALSEDARGHEVPVRLGGDLLVATGLALVPFSERISGDLTAIPDSTHCT